MEISRFVRSWVRSGFCCYDVGAALGYYTLGLSRLASPGRVYAIEGQKSQCHLLENTLTRNGYLKSEISILNLILGDVVDIRTRRATIDYLVFEGEHTPPDFIKVGVEGDERAVLLGARDVISQFSPKFIIEVHSEKLEEDCKLLLEQEGYEVMVVNQSRILPDYRPSPHNRWLCAQR